jgi:hypothetical protein
MHETDKFGRPKHSILTRKDTYLSARIGIVQPFTLLEFTVHLGVHGEVCIGASVVTAYTNDGYLGDAYR